MSKLLTALVLLSAPLFAETAALEQARALYQRTQYRETLKVIESARASGAAAWELTGRCHYMLDDFGSAIEAFQKAASANPANSVPVNWLGKSYGRKAENASFLSAPGLASKARQYFEKAVQLDPHNKEAISDLFDYYMEAPGFLGGGTEKAAALAERSRELDGAEYHYYLARLAEKRKDFQTAEKEYRRAVELAPNQAGRLIDLARFLSKRGRFAESDATFQRAEKITPDAPKLLFARASTYIRAKRNQTVARGLLEQYLKSSLTPDDPSRREAERLLKEVRSGG